MINWTNLLDKISQYFQVREAIYLPKWGRLANPTDGFTEDSQIALIALFQTMDKVYELLGVPIIVHCAFRSPKYNVLVNGADGSAHIARLSLVDGKKYYIAACDWHPVYPDMNESQCCDHARPILEPHLESLGLRLENNPKGSPWIHTDSRPIPKGGSRIFKP